MMEGGEREGEVRERRRWKWRKGRKGAKQKVNEIRAMEELGYVLVTCRKRISHGLIDNAIDEPCKGIPMTVGALVGLSLSPRLYLALISLNCAPCVFSLYAINSEQLTGVLSLCDIIKLRFS